MIQALVFYLFATVTVLSAVMVVTSRNPVWKERHELSNFKWKEGMTLTFKVFDHDEGAHEEDDYIGRVSW